MDKDGMGDGGRGTGMGGLGDGSNQTRGLDWTGRRVGKVSGGDRLMIGARGRGGAGFLRV